MILTGSVADCAIVQKATWSRWRRQMQRDSLKASTIPCSL